MPHMFTVCFVSITVVQILRLFETQRIQTFPNQKETKQHVKKRKKKAPVSVWSM